MPAQRIDLTGQRFGRLVVESFAGSASNRDSLWRCICDCGNFINVRAACLKRNRPGRKSPGTRSCGCLRIDAPSTANTRHGGFGSRLYNIWASMKQRCSLPSHSNFSNYGGRGIRVCDEWLEFTAFRDWAVASGYGDGLSIDRVDNDQGYSPDNCRWATRIEQGNNKRTNRILLVGDRRMTVAEWSREIGIKEITISTRLRNGWTDADAVSPLRRRNHK